MVLSIVLTLATCFPAVSRERPVVSCEKAPLLAEYQGQLPDHVLAESADKKPKILSGVPRIGASIITRSNTTLVCIVVALDENGVPQTLAVSYPKGFQLTEEERGKIMAARWSAAEIDGQVRPSLLNIDVSVR